MPEKLEVSESRYSSTIRDRNGWKHIYDQHAVEAYELMMDLNSWIVCFREAAAAGKPEPPFVRAAYDQGQAMLQELAPVVVHLPSGETGLIKKALPGEVGLAEGGRIRV